MLYVEVTELPLRHFPCDIGNALCHQAEQSYPYSSLGALLGAHGESKRLHRPNDVILTSQLANTAISDRQDEIGCAGRAVAVAD